MSYHSNPTKRIDSPIASRCNSPRKAINNRRKSVADEAALTQQYIQANIEELTRLWDEVHMSEENRVARLSTAHDHIRKLVDEMVESEQAMVDGVKNDISSIMSNIQKMREEMSMDEWTSRHPNPSIALLRAVEKEEQQLKEVYDVRVHEQEQVMNRVDVLCFRLGKFAVDLLPDAKQLLSNVELKKLKKKVAEMETDLEDRIRHALKLQSDIRLWTRNLGKVFGPSDDVTLHVIIDENIEDDNFALTDAVMEQLNQFWTELSGMHRSWVDNVDLEWVQRYSILEELWEKCHVGESDRVFPPRFDPARHGEKDVEAMDAEINRLQTLYADREPIYKLVSEWKNAWKEKLNLEEKKKDASYYQSRERGHNLMRDVQYERHLNEVQLPKLKRSISTSYSSYTSQHEDSILIDGYEPLAFIAWTEDEYKLNRELERSAKKNMKEIAQSPSRNLKSAPRTPSSLSRTPAKQARIAKDPPQVSIITPVRLDEGGPKTSSPKDAVLSTPNRLNSPMKRRNL